MKMETPQDRVAAYKRVLQEVLDGRPSGMRQRLAEALRKNRSFISLISNPGYPTPIPVQHIEPIFEICHFSPRERERFLVAYRTAHPRRLQLLKEEHTITSVNCHCARPGYGCRNRQLRRREGVRGGGSPPARVMTYDRLETGCRHSEAALHRTSPRTRSGAGIQEVRLVSNQLPR
jgi:hypothetical protein